MNNKLDKIIVLLSSIDENLKSLTDNSEPSPSKQSGIFNASQKENNKLMKLELERTRTMLLHSEKMASLGSMAAGVAHELNNPLAWILSNFQIIEDKYIRNLCVFNKEIDNIIKSDETNVENFKNNLKSLKAKLKIDFILEDIQEMISESMDGAVKMRTIIEGLRSFAHTDGGEFEETNLSEILDSAITIAYNQIKYVAKIHKEYQAIPPCEAIPSRLSQVFLNIIINAVQAIKPTLNKDNKSLGNLWIRIKNSENKAFVEIEDDGEGIPPEHLPRIFEPYYRVPGTRRRGMGLGLAFCRQAAEAMGGQLTAESRVGEGTGLGLPIVYKIVEEHHGHINVESTIGKGTKFIIILPLKQPEKISDK